MMVESFLPLIFGKLVNWLKFRLSKVNLSRFLLHANFFILLLPTESEVSSVRVANVWSLIDSIWLFSNSNFLSFVKSYPNKMSQSTNFK